MCLPCQVRVCVRAWMNVCGRSRVFVSVCVCK